MSRSLKRKKNHWTGKVHESVLCRDEQGRLGLELQGGAEHGLFPVVGELPAGGAACHSGRLLQDELLLEVNDTPVAGLTTRDVHAWSSTARTRCDSSACSVNFNLIHGYLKKNVFNSAQCIRKIAIKPMHSGAVFQTATQAVVPKKEAKHESKPEAMEKAALVLWRVVSDTGSIDMTERAELGNLLK
ncbi:unnamed protein product [Pleuronectes platessa]|uniref:PDZ domain-containing protein n=1 Tax=Pleuronectes platessa TaxID=8262 RepID=A0A9N7YCS2_PLEPL|nr:unnamed protein product [Pleuronectes platessa]